MDSQRPNDVSPEAMQARIQQARREAETLKDRIKRKKDELADTTRELNALFLVHRHNQLPAMRASSVLICLCSRKLAHSICTPFHPIDHILHQAASWVCLPGLLASISAQANNYTVTRAMSITLSAVSHQIPSIC
jgi:hypothetical protein